ncbi:hypothetical protein [Promicromonospora iranensis]|uniref:Abortive infection Abi-like protein n=1 Tax=Promicromonospora iranensis TaxID=1105144 RepID=A0ABU2CQH9_9MICO|nr:hypothetical protein [Promicromonospora iranensis]MDR7383599.1 hypothetical protein [Promicromonospora iranensis]
MASSGKPTKAMLAAIGRVAAESAAVEDQLRDLFCHLIGSPYGRVITAGEDLSNITKSCLRIARYHHGLTDEQIEQLVTIVKAIERLRPHRNFLVHATWVKMSEPGKHFGTRSSRASSSMRTEAQGMYDSLIWRPADAEKIADAFSNVAVRIDAFIEQAFDRPAYEPPIEREAWAKFNAMLSPAFDVLDAPVDS